MKLQDAVLPALPVSATDYINPPGLASSPALDRQDIPDILTAHNGQ